MKYCMGCHPNPYHVWLFYQFYLEFGKPDSQGKCVLCGFEGFVLSVSEDERNA